MTKEDSCNYYLYVADFGDLVKIGVTNNPESRLKQVSSVLRRELINACSYEFKSIDDAEFVESSLKNMLIDYAVTGEKIKTEVFSLKFCSINSLAVDLIGRGEFGKALNPRGAGRKANTWSSRKMTVPDPIRAEVKKIINDWIKENKQ